MCPLAGAHAAGLGGRAATAPRTTPPPPPRDFTAAREQVWDGSNRFVLRDRVWSGHEYHAYERSHTHSYGVSFTDPVYGRVDTRRPLRAIDEPRAAIELSSSARRSVRGRRRRGLHRGRCCCKFHQEAVPMLTIGSLFSGVAGLELGVEAALAELGRASRIVWQAEKDPYARAVLAKHWPDVRRYEDVHDIDDGAERPDLICGGFPCQDLSIAGKRVGISGARSGLWSQFVRVVRVLRPPIVLVENVPELLGYLGHVLGPLAELGYDAEWDLFDAAACGAPHLRERLFILAHLPDAPRLGREGGQRGGARAQHAAAPRPRGARAVAHADGLRQLQPPVSGQGLGDGAGVRGPFPDAGGEQLRQQQIAVARSAGAALARVDGQDRPMADADGCRLARRQPSEGPARARQGRGAKARTEPPRPPAWPPEPDVGRVVDGPRSRLDGSRRRARLRCLGNGVVPQQARLAFLTLAARAGLTEAPHG